jgi:type IV pilus assembly protein PilW
MKSNQSGLSLVELMIAITLGLFLLTGVVQVFLSSKTVYTSQQAMSRVQEAGRLAIDFMAKDIRMAGYMGCASRPPSSSIEQNIKNMLNSSTDFKYDFAKGIQGYTASTLPAGAITTTPKTGTDIVVIRNVGGSGVRITKTNDSAQLFAEKVGAAEVGVCPGGSDRISGICQQDILVVSDCTKARVFQATNVTESGSDVNIVHSSTAMTPGNATSSWGGASTSVDEQFKPGAEILVATTKTYFIANNATTGQPSLWQSVNGVDTELLEGVEDMSILYGVDTSTDLYAVPSKYIAAGTVTSAEWARVVAVRIELLVATTENNVVPEPQKYKFKGVDITPSVTDKRLRQVFSTTIAVRSRAM